MPTLTTSLHSAGHGRRSGGGHARARLCAVLLGKQHLAKARELAQLAAIGDAHRARPVSERRPIGHRFAVASQQLPHVAAPRRVAQVRVYEGVRLLGDASHLFVVRARPQHRLGQVGGGVVQLAALLVARAAVREGKGHVVHEGLEQVVVVLEVGRLLLEHDRVGGEELDEPMRVRVAVEVDQVLVLGVPLHRKLLEQRQRRQQRAVVVGCRRLAERVVLRHVPD